MPWMETCSVLERWKFVEAALRKDRPFTQLCREAGISRDIGYKWLRRFEERPGLEALQNRSRAPLSSPTRTSPRIEKRIRALRKEYSAGGVIIAAKLAEEKVRIAPRTVDRVLARLGLIKEKDRRGPATKRFARPEPNQLWQMDFKGPVAIGRYKQAVPLSILDDHSRFLVALRAHSSTDADAVRVSLTTVFREHGLPDAFLIDHGTPWWSTTNLHGLTWLSVWLIEIGIQLIYSGIRHPQTQGKVERFHRTLKRWLADRGQIRGVREFQDHLSVFRDLYNNRRPHKSLDYRVPAAAYRPSQRCLAQPRPWCYPEGATLRKVDSWGALSYRHRQHFVCEALIGRTVMCRELDGLLLVIFRNMVIREIDLRSGNTRAVVVCEDSWPTRPD